MADTGKTTEAGKIMPSGTASGVAVGPTLSQPLQPFFEFLNWFPLTLLFRLNILSLFRNGCDSDPKPNPSFKPSGEFSLKNFLLNIVFAIPFFPFIFLVNFVLKNAPFYHFTLKSTETSYHSRFVACMRFLFFQLQQLKISISKIDEVLALFFSIVSLPILIITYVLAPLWMPFFSDDKLRALEKKSKESYKGSVSQVKAWSAGHRNARNDALLSRKPSEKSEALELLKDKALSQQSPIDKLREILSATPAKKPVVHSAAEAERASKALYEQLLAIYPFYQHRYGADGVLSPQWKVDYLLSVQELHWNEARRRPKTLAEVAESLAIETGSLKEHLRREQHNNRSYRESADIVVNLLINAERLSVKPILLPFYGQNDGGGACAN